MDRRSDSDGSAPPFPAADLFNCCAGGVSPAPDEIARFAALEVSGVRDEAKTENWTETGNDPDCTCMVSCADDVAEFWSVYARLQRDECGIAECTTITDGPPGDKARALEIAAYLGRLWNLPVR